MIRNPDSENPAGPEGVASYSPAQPLTVSELTFGIKSLLEDRFPEVWVRGEVSNLRRQSSGHSYFSLKDSGSQIPCALFRGDAARQRVALRDGMQVIVFGRVSVYEPRGAYQLIARLVVEDGVGRLQQEFERLKQKLSEEGLFDSDRKRSLPVFPRTIGVVTSATGAALRDFVSILRRREWPGRVIVLPARVQGREAAGEIVAQLERAGAWGIFDLLVLTRGGGSLEDLWPFNEEAVARAVAAAPVPVISAVGHEIDFSLSDFAADVRAETPSAAAELISSLFLEVRQRFDVASEGLTESVTRRLENRRSRLELLVSEWKRHSPRNRIENLHLRLDDLGGQLRSQVRESVRQKRHELHRRAVRWSGLAIERRLQLHQERLHQLRLRLEGASPRSVLQRGFVIIHDVEGGFLQRSAQLTSGMPVRAEFADGEAEMTVD